MPTSWLRRVLAVLTGGRLGGPLQPFRPWLLAARRQNRALAARFRGRENGRAFVVATCHIPCLFGEPLSRQAKAIHLAVLLDSVHRFAGDAELVLAGDFNTKPDDAELGLALSGTIGKDELARPSPVPGLAIDAWLPEGRRRLRSAYREAVG